MSATTIVRDWQQGLRHHLLPRLHGHLSKALADGSEMTARELVGRIGGRWLGTGEREGEAAKVVYSRGR
ncbi:MAG: hypothetical protein L0Z62_26290 [Gemmataceae bacterium]|nr:hypothetical protein [Gemmataceae bacterium]